ncbi:MAG: hypothetical protein H0U74_10890 [Bradymonadaceae bacterium]|nr:hypothetical protein [Lujinxingiaceae bacterium]
MATKAHLLQITRELRRYVEWQAKSGALGAPEAPVEEREAWQSRQKVRDDARMATMRAALVDEKPRQVAPPSQPARPITAASGEAPHRPETPVYERSAAPRAVDKADEAMPAPAPQMPATVAQDENALWKQLGSQSRRTFEPIEEPAVPRTPSRPAAAVRGAAMSAPEKLDFLKNYLANCQRCALHQGRTNVVFGAGSAVARLMFIGEGPSSQDDKLGEPFVGESGELLNRMIVAMGFKREEVYLTNMVKCRPLENRNPGSDEIQQCSTYLIKQIEAIDPEIIVTLGQSAAQTLLQSDEDLGQLRGRWYQWRLTPLMATYHPESLLRNESLKRAAWSDLQLVMARLAAK